MQAQGTISELHALATRGPKEPVEVTVEVLQTVEVIQTVEVEVTRVVAATPSPILADQPMIPEGDCQDLDIDPPCQYVPRPGDSWPAIAAMTPYGNSCRWPEIANVNRLADGNYDLHIRPNKPVLIPPVAARGSHGAQIRNEFGEYELIKPCEDGGGFPCQYQAESQLSAYNYIEIAKRWYDALFHGGVDLADLIGQANRASDCSGNPISFRPGDLLVIPVRPFSVSSDDGGE